MPKGNQETSAHGQKYFVLFVYLVILQYKWSIIRKSVLLYYACTENLLRLQVPCKGAYIPSINVCATTLLLQGNNN